MPSDNPRYDSFGAGNAVEDLARADMEALFVQTQPIRDYLRREPGFPIVVGSKGAGKSLVLFKKLMQVRALSGVLVLPRHPRKAFTPQLDFGGNSHWSEFWQLWDDDRPRLDAWGTLWEWALTKTVLGAWLAHARRNDSDVVRIDELEELTGGEEEVDPFDLLSDYLQAAASGQNIVRGRFVLPRDLTRLRAFMIANSVTYPPTYLFLDNHDDSFEQDPHFWKASCLGTFRAIHSIHANTNRRVHCYLTVRPEIIWEAQRSEHFPRWRQEICHLTWSDDKLMELFSSRASRLSPDLLRDPASVDSNPVAAFLGRHLRDPGGQKPQIRNVRLEIDAANPIVEDVGSYILRHTLRRPRDLIVVGNQLIEEFSRAEPSVRSDPSLFRAAIENATQMIGQAYLAEVSCRWPWSDGAAPDVATFIKRYVRNNILHRSQAQRIEQELAADLKLDPTRVHPFDELARMGLVGYSKPDANTNGLVQRFVRVGEMTTEGIPRAAEWYFLHPVLYGDPFDLEVVKGHIVGPDLPVDPARLPTVPIATVKPAEAPAKHPWAFSWLHLSDVHFGAGSDTHRADLAMLADKILEDVRKHAPRGVDRVFVTGDISFSGKQKELDEARGWLVRLSEAVGASPAAIRVVPGNHDVNRRVGGQIASDALHFRARVNPEELDRYLSNVRSRRDLLKKLADYCRFVRQLQSTERLSNELDWKETITIGGAGRLRIAGISTVWVSNELDGLRAKDDGAFVPNMLLGKRSILDAIGQLADDEVPLILTHHPPEWLVEQCQGWLEEALGPRSSMHLCGHLHRARAAAMSSFGRQGQSVRLMAGAVHGDPADQRVFGYSWGALAWNPKTRSWELGWAPRVFAGGEMRADRTNHDLDARGFAWKPLQLPWREPEQPQDLPATRSTSTPR